MIQFYKRLLLCIVLITPVGMPAQNLVEVGADISALEVKDSTVAISPEDSIYNKAEADFRNFFAMHEGGQSTSKDIVYDCLMESFTNYAKCLEWCNDSTKLIIKGRVRRLHPYMQEAGYHFYSTNQHAKAYRFLEQFLTIPEMSIFAGEQFPRDRNYLTWVAYVANQSAVQKEYKKTDKYVTAYLDSGEKVHQERCYTYGVLALFSLGEFDRAAKMADEALMNYPNNMTLLTYAIDISMQQKKMEKAKEYLEQALALDSTDVNLVFLKGVVLYEEEKYFDALQIFERLQQQDPTDLSYMDRRAYCYYNMGVFFNNSVVTASKNDGVLNGRAYSSQEIELMREEGYKNMRNSIALFNTLLQASPDETSYIMRLIEANRSIGNTAEADRLQKQIDNTGFAMDVQMEDETAIPNFNEWAVNTMNEELEKWTRKDPFETTNEYKKRVNEKTVVEKKMELHNKLKEEFIAEYAHRYSLQFTIKDYDADHELYKLQSPKGDVFLPVPRANNEAKAFQKMWNNVVTENPKFDITKEGEMKLAELTFTLPNGVKYVYDASKPVNYGGTIVMTQFAKMTAEDMAQYGNAQTQSNEGSFTSIIVGDSDVDIEVPRNKRVNANTYALIFCNETYDRVGAVEFANADGNSFSNYCKQTLGIPANQIKRVENATKNQMIGELEELKNFMRSRGGNARVFVYYSGHGLPDPNTGDGYLVPSDAYPSTLGTCYKLSEMYASLSEVPSRSVTVFLDACFSGSKRNGEHMEGNARGVAIRSKATAPKGNMVVFSACSGDETAYPLEKQKHGLFTYHLLKKLQETKGRATYGELSEYLRTKVMQVSLDVNKKMQTPTVKVSNAINDVWEDWRMDREE